MVWRWIAGVLSSAFKISYNSLAYGLLANLGGAVGLAVAGPFGFVLGAFISSTLGRIGQYVEDATLNFAVELLAVAKKQGWRSAGRWAISRLKTSPSRTWQDLKPYVGRIAKQVSFRGVISWAWSTFTSSFLNSVTDQVRGQIWKWLRRVPFMEKAVKWLGEKPLEWPNRIFGVFTNLYSRAKRKIFSWLQNTSAYRFCGRLVCRVLSTVNWLKSAERWLSNSRERLISFITSPLEKGQEWLGQLWQKATNRCKAWLNNVKWIATARAWFGDRWECLRAFVTSPIAKAREWLERLWQKAADWCKAWLNNVEWIATARAWFGDRWERLRAFVTSPIAKAREWLGRLWQKAADWCKAWLNNVEWIATARAWFGDRWERLRAFVTFPIVKTQEWLGRLWQKATSQLNIWLSSTKWYTSARIWLSRRWESLKNAERWCCSHWERLTLLVTALVKKAQEWLGQFWENAKHRFAQWQSCVKRCIRATTDGIYCAYRYVTSCISHSIMNAVRRLRRRVSASWVAVKGWIEEACEFVSRCCEAVVPFFSSLWDWFADTVRTIYRRAKKAAREVWDGVRNVYRHTKKIVHEAWKLVLSAWRSVVSKPPCVRMRRAIRWLQSALTASWHWLMDTSIFRSFCSWLDNTTIDIAAWFEPFVSQFAECILVSSVVFGIALMVVIGTIKVILSKRTPIRSELAPAADTGNTNTRLIVSANIENPSSPSVDLAAINSTQLPTTNLASFSAEAHLSESNSAFEHGQSQQQQDKQNFEPVKTMDKTPESPILLSLPQTSAPETTTSRFLIEPSATSDSTASTPSRQRTAVKKSKPKQPRSSTAWKPRSVRCKICGKTDCGYTGVFSVYG